MFIPTPKAIRLMGLLTLVLVSTCGEITYAAGLLTPKHSGMMAPDIRSHDVDVIIENGYAITQVDQVFHNPNDTDIEAIYAFPVPAKAAVGEFTYWVDNQPVTGEVVEKARAREIYETEKSMGNETALVEKNEYRTFETYVYPVRAGQDVRIRLVYLQPVHIESGFGRYVYPLQDGGVDEMQEAFWHQQEIVSESFQFDLSLRSAYPLSDVRLPNHSSALIDRSSAQEWQVRINAAAGFEEASGAQQPAFKLNEDIVLYWRLAPGLPGSVDLVSYRQANSREGTFMLTVTPGDDLEEIRAGRDWTFVLDFSGSMQGKYSTLVDGIERALGKLRPEDRFRIFLFNNSSWELTQGYTTVSEQQIERYAQELNRLQPDGGTNLYAGLSKGLTGLNADRSSAVVLVTDGVANVGVTGKKAFIDLLGDRDVRLFTFVMGNSANRPLLEGMAKVSDGFAMNVSNGDDIYGKVLLAADKLTHQALRNIRVDIDGVRVRDLTPSDLSSLYRGEQLVLMGHYQGSGNADLSVTGDIGGREVRYDSRLFFADVDERNPELERLWAFATVDALQNRIDYLGQDSESREALVDIAVRYGLVTDHTSLIVVREELFEKYQIERNNQQRVTNENDARQQRSAAGIANHSQQAGQGFSQPRAYPSGGSGGGSLGPFVMLLLMMLVLTHRRVEK